MSRRRPFASLPLSPRRFRGALAVVAIAAVAAALLAAPSAGPAVAAEKKAAARATVSADHLRALSKMRSDIDRLAKHKTAGKFGKAGGSARDKHDKAIAGLGKGVARELAALEKTLKGKGSAKQKMAKIKATEAKIRDAEARMKAQRAALDKMKGLKANELQQLVSQTNQAMQLMSRIAKAHQETMKAVVANLK